MLQVLRLWADVHTTLRVTEANTVGLTLSYFCKNKLFVCVHKISPALIREGIPHITGLLWA